MAYNITRISPDEDVPEAPDLVNNVNEDFASLFSNEMWIPGNTNIVRVNILHREQPEAFKIKPL